MSYEVVGYQTEEDYKLNKPDVFPTECDDHANAMHSDLENDGYYLVITTDDNGTLIR